MTNLHTFEYHIYVMRNGAEFGEALSINDPQIEMVSDAEIKKSMSANLILPDGTDILHDTLMPKIIVDGVESVLGEYYIGTYTEQTNEYGQSYTEIEAYDGGYLPSRYRTENIIHFSAGANYVDTIQALLIEAGVEKIIATATSATLTNDREDWEIGTTYLAIINALLAEINYESLWFDNNGFARIAPKRVADPDTVHHKYTSGQYSILSVPRSRETDIFDKYNVFVAYVDSADNDELMIATAVNDDPASILSIQNRGRIQAPPQRLDNIASQEELQAYVDNWKNKSMSSTETLVISTGIDTAHEVRDTVQCEDNIYLEYSWSMDLGEDATLTHTLQREVFI